MHIHYDFNGAFPRLGLSTESDFSKSDTTVSSDVDFESDYGTGLEDFSNEKTEVKKPRLRRKLFKGLNDSCQTSSFIQNILSEDSKTGVAVVDLFVAVKTVKDNLDFLARKNDDVLHQIDALSVESGVVRNEYRNLAKDMRSFLDELNDETISERLLQKYKRNLEKYDKMQEESVRDLIEGWCPKFSRNSVDYLKCIVSILKGSTKDRPGISKTLLGSFLASVLWLKKREASLSKSFAGSKEEKPTISDSTVRMICDMCEMLAKLAESASEDDERFSEREEQNSHSLKVSYKANTNVESSESDSAFDEAFSTPPPSPRPDFFEPKLKPSATCMGDLTKGGKKKSVSTGTDGSSDPVAVMLKEEIKPTVTYLKSKKAVTDDQAIKRTDEDLEKLPEAVKFTIAHTTATGGFDAAVRKQEEPRSYSSDSLDNLIDFDLDDVVSSSLSGGDELEEFGQTSVVTSKSVSKATQPLLLAYDASIVTTFKTVKPTFFEVWKCYPKHFIQEVISRTAKVRQEKMKEQKNASSEAKVIPLLPGEKREQEVVIENSNLDLVIYIQVEVEDDDKREQLLLDFEKNSFGTQTSNHINEFPIVHETRESKKYLYNIWSKCEPAGIGEVEESDTITSGEITKMQGNKKVGKAVAFADEVSEIFLKQDTPFEPKETKNAVAVAMAIKEGLLTANIYFQQPELHSAYLIKRLTPFYRAERNVELEKALQLIHEIENNVVDTKLSDAILILPRLESELRKHFKHKVKNLGETELDKSFDTFFSALDIWPTDVAEDPDNESSGERLCNLLALLDDLEKAVRASECSTAVELCEYDSSKIYGLLHALTESIRELEECSNVTSLSQTLDIASQVDTAVREFENIVKRTPTEYVAPMSRRNRRRLRSQISGEIPPKQHLENVRKRVFEMVEEEAIDTEGRLEKDIDKLERLERQNDEAMKFVEAFLKKTQRRATEVASAKTELKELSIELSNKYEKVVKAKNSKKRTSQEEEPSGEGEPVTSSREETVEKRAVSVKETVSGLLLALDNLKSRAKEKNELCREILSRMSLEKEMKEHDTLWRSSRSSFTAKNVEGLHSQVRDFRKIGDHSLYLSWTKPEGALADSLAGYEIFVNGKLNQKVRNPQRLQAILYSIDLSETAEVLLYGLLDNGFRIFLATATYVIS